MSKEREEHAREVSSLTEARDRLQETLRGIGGWEEREEGEGEEVSAGDERSRGLLEQLGRVEEMNRKTSASLKETMEKTKVSCKMLCCGSCLTFVLVKLRPVQSRPHVERPSLGGAPLTMMNTNIYLPENETLGFEC